MSYKSCLSEAYSYNENKNPGCACPRVTEQNWDIYMKTPTQNGLVEGNWVWRIRFSGFVTPTHLLVIFKTWKGSEN